jgi:hypothetical protein
MNDRIVSITLPKCGTCRFAGNFINGMADCYGMPPVPMMLGASQDALGRPQMHIEAVLPKVKQERPACALYDRKQDFATTGNS